MSCVHGVPLGDRCPGCDAFTAEFRAGYEASVAAGDHYRSGHTPEEWANSTPLLPFDPDVVQYDNGEELEEEPCED